MGKPTPTKEDQPFIYQLGQDVAKLGFEIEKLKNKSVKAVRIVVPATPEKYQAYGIKAVINLPPECQHAICIKSQNGNVSLIETGETLSVYAEVNTSEFYLAPVYRLEAETINAELDQKQMSDIDAAKEREERERQEREERERQEREERERQEREERERQEREYKENYVYYALVKYAMKKYKRDLDEKEGLDDIKLVPNWLGLDDFLLHPFLRVENGLVKSKKDYLKNTQDIISDLKAQVSMFESEKRDIDDGVMAIDLSKLEKPVAYQLAIL